jgi:hypothetical protein
MGSIFITCFVHFFGNSVQSLIPVYPLPFAIALPADPFHGILDSIGIINMLKLRKALGAHRSIGDGIRVSFNMSNDPILDSYQNTAAAVTAFTRGLNYFPFAH